MKEMKNNWQTYLIKAIGFAFALCLLQLGFISSADAILPIDRKMEITKEWVGGAPVGVNSVEVEVKAKAPGWEDTYTFYLNEGDGWKAEQLVGYTFDGNPCTYEFKEITPLPDYIVNFGEVQEIPGPVAKLVCTVTNTKNKQDMTIIKRWASPAPDNVTTVIVKVTAETEDGPVDLAGKSTFELTAPGWQLTQRGYPITHNGKKVLYKVTEVTAVEGFESSVSEVEEVEVTDPTGAKKFQCTVTNSKKPLESYNPPQPDPEPQPQPDQYRRMTLTKEWVGGEPEGVEEVLVQVVGTVETMNQLSQDIQDKLTYTFRLTKTDNWTEDLNVLWYVFNPANKVKYTITEVTEVPGYTSQVGELKLVDADPVSQREKEWTCTITNTRTTEESARQLMEITKQWIGDATVDEVVIEAQGRVPGKDLSDNELAALKYTFTLSKTNNWKAEQVVMSVWNGAEVVYTLKELTNVPGYTSQVGELKLENVNKATHIEQKWTCTVTNTKTEESKSEPKPEPKPEPQPKPDETLGDDGTPTGSTELPKTDGISASVALLMGAMIVSGGYVLRKRK